MPFYIKASGLSYSFENGSKLFKNINFTLTAEKAGLIGVNGCGKSTLLKLISGEIKPAAGAIEVNGAVTRFFQDQTHIADLTIAEVIGLKAEFEALHRILDGKGTEEDFSIIDKNWDIEERAKEILSQFNLANISFERTFGSLSGGEAGRLLLASCLIKKADYILFDEPTNHLDTESRKLFYKMIDCSKNGMLIVSHDRQLLKKMDKILELTGQGIKIYGGNYDTYLEQKMLEQNAIEQRITEAESSLKKQVKISSTVIKTKERKNALGKQRREDGSLLKAVLNKRRGQAEHTIARLTEVHEKKINQLSENLNSYKNMADRERIIKIDLLDDKLKSKMLITALQINYKYSEQPLWRHDLSFDIKTGERVLLSGKNGTGKTTLVNMILQNIKPACGRLIINCKYTGIVDQRYELIRPGLTLLDNMRLYAPSKMPEHELRIRLSRFLFYNDDAFKPAGILSGGEKNRLAMACLLASDNLPEMIILDEPTNNLDLKSIIQLQDALEGYRGALIIISHDADFIKSAGITKTINLDDYFNLE